MWPIWKLEFDFDLHFSPFNTKHTTFQKLVMVAILDAQTKLTFIYCPFLNISSKNLHFFRVAV